MMEPVAPLRFSDIPGLDYYAGIIDRGRQENFVRWIDSFASSEWLADFQRRKLCFGYLYDYAARDIARYIGPLPAPLIDLARELVAAGFLRTTPDQAIVNEYLPGQGISRHTDARCFGEEIAGLSLSSTSVIRFRERRGPAMLDLLLEPGSLFVMTGPARALFTHEIPGRQKDFVRGIVHRRSRRLSITFRTIICPPRSKHLMEGRFRTHRRFD